VTVTTNINSDQQQQCVQQSKAAANTYSSKSSTSLKLCNQ